MRGCLRDLGCLFLIAMLFILVTVGWFARDFWLPMTPFAPKQGPVAAWEAPSPQGARRADSALKALQRPRGPAFANLQAGDMIAWVIQEFARTMPSSTDSIQAAVIGERLHVRARVRTKDLGGQAVLGPIAWLLDSERERIEFGGVVRVIRPGFGEFQVKTVKVREYALPQSLIPTLVSQIAGANRSKELSPDGLQLDMPAFIGDIRVAGGRITVYKRQ